MKKNTIIISFILIISGIILTWYFENNKNQEVTSKDTYIIQFHHNIDEKLIKDNGGNIKQRIDKLNALEVELKPNQVNKLKKNKNIKEIDQVGIEGDWIRK